jgi:hypothetical protein
MGKMEEAGSVVRFPGECIDSKTLVRSRQILSIGGEGLEILLIISCRVGSGLSSNYDHVKRIVSQDYFL